MQVSHWSKIVLWIDLAVVQACKTSGSSSSGAGSADASALVSKNPLRRLTNSQYENTIVMIFGNKIVVPTLTATDIAVEGLTAAGASQVSMRPTDAEGYVAA